MGEPRYRERKGRSMTSSDSRFVPWYTSSSFSWGDGGFTQVVGFEAMSDVNNKLERPESPVVHEKYEGRPLSIRGSGKYFNYYMEFQYSMKFKNRFLTNADYRDSSTGHLYVSTPDDYTLPTLFFARLNPSNASVDVAAAAIESIVELPGIIKNATEALGRKYNISDVGSLPISYLFGILPVVRMIQSLATLGEDIEKRMRQLDQLQSTEGRKIRMKLYTANATSESKWTDSISGSQILERKVTVAEISAIINDRIVNHVGGLRTKKRYSVDDVRKVLTSDRPISTLWEVLPWSWLVDYFLGIGEFLKATSNRIPGYEVSTATIMRSTKTHCDWQYARPESLRFVHESVSATPGYYNRKSYRRTIMNNPTPNIPRYKTILTDSQIGTLIALGTAIAAQSRLSGIGRIN